MKGFFKGSATALITPFDEKGVNYEVLGQLIEHQIARCRSKKNTCLWTTP